MSTTKDDVTKVIDQVLTTLKRLDALDLPEEHEHLRSYAYDGIYGAVGYLRTIRARQEHPLP